eukprot:m.127736 g.127736  ORF g.127736 m.127736 type:complete len:58 (+) comp13855_c0_seq2:212-385(+)
MYLVFMNPQASFISLHACITVHNCLSHQRSLASLRGDVMHSIPGIASPVFVYVVLGS